MGIGNLGLSELLVLAVLVLVFFGPRRLPEIARSLGGALREFRRGWNEIRRELDEVEGGVPGDPGADRRREGDRGSGPRQPPRGRVEPGGRADGDADGAVGEEAPPSSAGGERPPAGDAGRDPAGDGDAPDGGGAAPRPDV